MAWSRRRFFGMSSGLFGLLAAPRALSANWFEERSTEVFAYGVASGDPHSDSILLWTHINTLEPEVSVQWELYSDPLGAHLLQAGELTTHARRDHTVKTIVSGLEADRIYYFRFFALDSSSPIGRTKTAPSNTDNIRLALVSCSSIWSGYFTAYQHLANRDDIDLIVHCGDYIYDIPDKNEMRLVPLDARDMSQPQNLSELRRRHRYYRANPHLRAAHQQHPWAVLWDNHDVWTAATYDEGVQVFLEWLPIRERADQSIYRTLDFGPLAKIIFWDTRQTGRITGESIPGTRDASLLGEKQFQWFRSELEHTSHWNLMVSQVLFSSFTFLGIPLLPKTWARYGAERDRVFRALAETGSRNNLVLSGDAHVSFALDLEWKDEALGAEFMPTSVTRGNIDEVLGDRLSEWGFGTAARILKRLNPKLQYFEASSHGYGLIDIRQERIQLEFWYVDHKVEGAGERLAAAYELRSGEGKLRELSSLVPSKGSKWESSGA